MSGRRILSCLSRAAEHCCADAESRGPVFEPLELRLLLSGDVVPLGSLYDCGASSISPAWFEDLVKTTGPTQQEVKSVAGYWISNLEQTPGDSQSGSTSQTAIALEGQWIVQLTRDALKGVSHIADTVSLFSGSVFGIEVVRGLGMAGQLLIETHGAAADAVSAWLSSNTSVAYASPDTVLSLQAMPNDPSFTQLWGMNNTGQTGGTADADIDAPEAWNLATGSPGVVVGVIDTGVDYTHPDLAANIWTNPGEIAGNAIDDDGNGFIDDIHGYDFVNNDGDPMDDHYHGTHVSGTIAGVGNNGVGVTGVNWNAGIMGLKFLDSSGNGSSSNAIRAINYATMMHNRGVNIHLTNNSWGDGGFEQSLRDAIQAAGTAGMLFIAAAGNGGPNGIGDNNDTTPYYPASYPLDNIIAVAATDHNDARASFSNYGAVSVDLGAPGVSIYSTRPGNTYGSLQGTSMAAPHVAGVAALAWSVAPTASYQTIRDAILNGVDHIPSMSGVTVTGGRLNAYGALQQLGPEVTIVASDASAAERGLDPGTFTVSRTGGTAAALEIFYTVSGSAGNGVDYQQIPLSVMIPAGSASAQITITPIDDSWREGYETVVLTLQSSAGFLVGVPGAATITIADDDLVFSTNNFAVSETTKYGSIVSSSLLNTLASDNVYERLKEALSGGNPSKAYSRLEHKWTFNVAAGGRVTFFVEAYHTANTEGDDFRFEYSTDGTIWTTLLTVTKTADDNVAQQAALPDGLSGTVYIRVVDTDRTSKNKVLDSLYIDKMFIRSDPSIAGDANVDGIVDASDYIALKMAFGKVGNVAWNDGDFNQDGNVEYADLFVLMSNFGRSFTLAPAAAPIASEPAPIAAATVAVATDPAKTAEIIPSPDTTVAPAPAAPNPASAAAVSAFPLAQTFFLHSNPGALLETRKTIYLDFDGHTTTGTSWNNYTGGAAIVTPAYSFEGDSSFSDNELARIQYIWQRVAEDFIPFNVDVTTEDPGLAAIVGRTDGRYGQRVVIGGDSLWYQGLVYGGLASIGSFGSTYDKPCFVFSDNLGISDHGNEKYVAEAISHEVGHTLKLYHDGVTGGVVYYRGQGEGPTGWAPLMGIGYYKELTQWSKGEYAGANNHKDELSILAGATGGFGYRLDDHGGTFATAAGLTVVVGTNVSGEGIIERTADLDFFSFTTGQGLVSLSIDPAPRGPNLDILATLYDILGEVVAVSNPIGALNASFSLSLPAGTYYLSIDGTGEGDPLVTGYSDYGSLGYYSITGTIVPEPATMSLLALGGLSLLKRKRKTFCPNCP